MNVQNKEQRTPDETMHAPHRRTVQLLIGSVIVLILIIVGLVGVGAMVFTRKQPLVTQVIVLTPTPQPTLAATLSATLVHATPTPSFTFGAVRSSDTFDRPDRSLFRPGANANAQYRFEGGRYTITVTNSNYIAWSPIRGVFSDSAIETDVTLQRGPSETVAGIVFRYQDAQNFYFFGVSGDGYYVLAILENGKWTPLLDWTISPHVNGEGQSNRLRVEVVSDRFRVFANGTLLDESRDAMFKQGGIALAVNTFDKGDATVLFDNFVLYGMK